MWNYGNTERCCGLNSIGYYYCFKFVQYGQHQITVAALRNVHAFESAHPQSYVIAHISFRGKLSPYKPNNR